MKRAGLVTQRMMSDWVREAGVELRGASVDESPHCYKRRPEVLAEHVGSIKILHTLRPSGSQWPERANAIRTKIEISAEFGGPARTRTGDLYRVKVAL